MDLEGSFLIQFAALSMSPVPHALLTSMDGMGATQTVRNPIDFPLIIQERSQNFFCTSEKTSWEKKSLAIF